MKIVLLEDVKNIGKKDEIKEVKDGYANFLIKNQKAKVANQDVLEKLNIKKENEQKSKEKNISENEKNKEIIKNQEIILFLKTNKEKTFGQITNKKIAEEITKKTNIKIDKNMIILKEKINKIGTYKIKIKLINEVVFEHNIIVKGEK